MMKSSPAPSRHERCPAGVTAERTGQAADAAFDAMAAVDRDMSDYKPESELSRLSAAAGGEERAVSEPLFEEIFKSPRGVTLFQRERRG